MNTLIWFRRDLRVHDNPALYEALAQGSTQAVYIATPGQWRQHHVAPIQVDLIRRHLEQLSVELAELGVQLCLLNAADFKAQIQVLKAYCTQNGIQSVHANSEPEVNECHRDRAFQQSGIPFTLHHCDTILPLGSVLNKQHQMFKVFTPFKKAWLKQLQQQGVTCIARPGATQHHAKIKTSPTVIEPFDYPCSDSSRWPLSHAVMQTVVPDFLRNQLDHYQVERDYPGIPGTSRLSPYLAIGAISPRWLVTQLLQAEPELIDDPGKAGFAWLNELIWRDFYKHLLFHFPDLAKGQCFQSKYQPVVWQHHPDHFKAWCSGQTGYPIVDAAMQQLLQTGWMHNRLRMVVASFLTKHLLIDWRCGERFFMSQLIDGDLSANNGGWQWAASTGCDAQPYFRIFNPITQSQKFDPKGSFIRKYLPELREVPDKQIHFPHAYLSDRGESALYCAPIVEHKHARERALAFFKRYQ